MSKKDIFRGYTVFYIFLIACVLLIAQLFILSLSKDRVINSINIPSVERGSIYDRMGRLLAEQVETFTISLWLEDVRRLRKNETEAMRDERYLKTAESLALITFIPADDLYSKIIDKTMTNIDLVKRANIDVKESIEKIISNNNIKGVRITSDYLRYYPNGSLASNLLGYVNTDRHGGAGIEYAFEQFLSPPFLGSNNNVEEGKSLELTIDANLQGIVEKRVKKAFAYHKASSAIAIIADAKTGSILSYVNLPTFDSNFYNLADSESLKNRAVSVAYEPGSVFKVFSIASMIDVGLIKEDDIFTCNGSYEVNGKDEKIIIKCQGNHGKQTIRQVLSNSCNAGTAEASERIKSTVLYNHLQDFGFGRKTEVPLPGETAGLLSNAKEWSARSRPTISFGQEVAVSAIQIIQAATAIANGGQMLKPQFVKRVINKDGTTAYQFKKEVVGEPISPETASTMLNLLSYGVTEGIARRMYIEGLEIAAKTGTSQTYDYKTGTYSDDNYVASTLSIFPANKPEYILYIAFDSPKGSSYFGSAVVAPLMKDITLDLIPYVGIQLDNTTTFHLDKNINLTTKKEEFVPSSSKPMTTSLPSKKIEKENKKPIFKLKKDNLVPDFTGLNARDALAKVKGMQIILKIDGDENSVVEEQFPPPTSLVQAKMVVVLYMRDKELPVEESVLVDSTELAQ